MSKTSEMIDNFNLVSFFNAGRRRKRGNTHYGGLNRRMLAATIDSFFLLVFGPMVNRLSPIVQVSAIDPNDPNAVHQALTQITGPAFIHSYIMNLALQLFIFCVFSGLCWHYWSATPGKMLLRMKIVDAKTEGPMTPKQIGLRLLGYWPSCFLFFLGALWIGIDKKKRGWHDFIAGTVVITLPWKKTKTGEVEDEIPAH